MVHGDREADCDRSKVANTFRVHGGRKNHKDEGEGKNDLRNQASSDGDICTKAMCTEITLRSIRHNHGEQPGADDCAEHLRRHMSNKPTQSPGWQ